MWCARKGLIKLHPLIPFIATNTSEVHDDMNDFKFKATHITTT